VYAGSLFLCLLVLLPQQSLGSTTFLGGVNNNDWPGYDLLNIQHSSSPATAQGSTLQAIFDGAPYYLYPGQFNATFAAQAGLIPTNGTVYTGFASTTFAMGFWSPAFTESSGTQGTVLVQWHWNLFVTFDVACVAGCVASANANASFGVGVYATSSQSFSNAIANYTSPMWTASQLVSGNSKLQEASGLGVGNFTTPQITFNGPGNQYQVYAYVLFTIYVGVTHNLASGAGYACARVDAETVSSTQTGCYAQTLLPGDWPFNYVRLVVP
jgi:hypothetical protein